MKLSIVIPAYNEKKNIGDTLNLILSSLENQNIEINVVDDGSTDNTADILNIFSNQYRFIHVFRHEKNRGYADALKTGFENSGGEFIAILDADLQNYPIDIKRLARYTDEYDVVVGWRKDRRDKLPRKIISWLYNSLAHLLFGSNLLDINGKPKLFRAEILKSIEIETREWTIDLELVHKAKKLGYKIIQVPVKHRKRGKGMPKTDLKKGLITIFDLFRYRWKSGLLEAIR